MTELNSRLLQAEAAMTAKRIREAAERLRKEAAYLDAMADNLEQAAG